MQAYEAGNITSANMFAQQANGIRELGQVGNIFDLNNDAQQGGSIASIFIPLGTLVKAGAGAAKITKTTKTLNSAADANKAGHVGDAVKVPEPKGPNGNGGKVAASNKLKQKNLPCFKKNKKGDPVEYDRQLKGQQDGLNNMTAKEYLDGRAAYTGSRKSTLAKRDAYFEEIAEKYFKNGTAKSKAEAKSMANEKMKTLNALHNPDMIVGGKDIIADFGDAGVNKSIGSQWKSRVSDLDEAAANAIKDGIGNHKMNIRMHRCP